eukprot:g4320.t1
MVNTITRGAVNIDESSTPSMWALSAGAAQSQRVRYKMIFYTPGQEMVPGGQRAAGDRRDQALDEPVRRQVRRDEVLDSLAPGDMRFPDDAPADLAGKRRLYAVAELDGRHAR